MSGPAPLTLNGEINTSYRSADMSQSMTNITEDSLYAFNISYEVLRDRFNKLKAENRKLLLHCHSCHHCRLTASSPGKPTVVLPPTRIEVQRPDDGLPDTTELIRQVTDLRLKLESAMSTRNSDHEYPSLSSAVETLCELERQMSRSPDAILPAGQSIIVEDDSSYFEELDSVNNCIVEQFDELAIVCETLRQQNAVLHNLVKDMFDRKIPCSPVYAADDDGWSLMSVA